MIIKNNLKNFPPQFDLPFLNLWRDKILERAWELGIKTPVQRELIDWEELFNQIKDASLIKRSQVNDIDNNIINLKKSGFNFLADKMQQIKDLVLNIRSK